MNYQGLAKQVQAARHPLPPAGDGPRVLVVEPNTRLRQSLIRLLWACKVTAAEAADADSAVEAVREWRPTVAVVEPRMPEVGVRIISRLLAVDAALRVIAYAHDAPNLTRVLLDAGAHRVILKGTGAIATLIEELPDARGIAQDATGTIP